MTGPTLIALLAAGQASRFGADKLAAPCAGAALGSYAARAVTETGLTALCIVPPGARPGWLPDGFDAIANPAAATGLASSVALAARIAIGRRAGALVLHLADMPCVPPALLRELAAADGTAACRYPSGRGGVPARFAAQRFDRLAALTGDRGASALLASEDVVTLVACSPETLVDVDTPEALARAEALLARR